MAPLAQAGGANGTVPPGIDPMELLLDMPALQYPPPGADTTMTTDGPDQVWFLVVAITCIAVPGIFLLIRMYTKLVIVRSLELADYFLMIAFPLIIVEVVMGYYMIKYGAGVHQWQVTLRQLFKQLYWMNTAEVIYCPLSFIVKMAILLQYLRLFAPSRQLNRVMWYGAWATIAACFCFYTVFMFWTMFYCRPRQMIWNKLTPDGKCHDHGPIVISQGAFNMSSDIVILLLPTSSLWQLKVPLGRKIVITLLFATGLLACAASAMRIAYTVKIAPVISMADVSHNGLFIGLWTEAEVALGFIVACSLSLPKLIQAKRKSLGRAFSFMSSPITSLRGTVRSRSSSRSRSTTLKSQSNGASAGRSRGDSVGMGMQPGEGKQAVFYEERQIVTQRQHDMYPIQEVPDANAIPGTSGSSNYSQSIQSKTSSEDTIPPVVPLKWGQHSPYNQSRTSQVAPSSSLHSPGEHQSQYSHSRNASQHTTWSHATSQHTAYEADITVLPSTTYSPSPSHNSGYLQRAHEDEQYGNGAFLNGTPVSAHPNRLTQEEIYVLQQFRFDSFRDSIDVQRTADRALSRP